MDPDGSYQSESEFLLPDKTFNATSKLKKTMKKSAILRSDFTR